METYYTPTIEEFHVGLNWEWYARGSWSKDCITDVSEISNKYFGTTIPEMIERNLVRVKHLDHDDITSCGWKPIDALNYQIGEDDDLWYAQLTLEERGTYLISKFELSGNDGNRLDYSVMANVHGLKILNKSELQFLMSRLSIK